MKVPIVDSEYWNEYGTEVFPSIREHISIDNLEISYFLQAKLKPYYFMFNMYFEQGMDDNIATSMRIYDEKTDSNYQIKQYWHPYNVNVCRSTLINNIYYRIEEVKYPMPVYDRIKQQMVANIDKRQYDLLFLFVNENLNLEHLKQLLLLLCGV